MFEKAKPISRVQEARSSESSGRFPRNSGSGGTLERDSLIGNHDSMPEDAERASDALQKLEWSELSARLAAARDLRLLLRRDASRGDTGGHASFADAASQYFRTRNDSEPDVNPVALEHCKGSQGNVHKRDQAFQGLSPTEARKNGHAATGHSRED